MSNQDKLIEQEQDKLDQLIRRMDNVLLKIHKDLTRNELKIRKSKAACLPEAYGDLISAQNYKSEGIARVKRLERSRDELYKTRIEVKCTDAKGTEREDIKIGLHSFIYGPDVFIMSWKLPVSRHYLLDNAAVEFENITREKDGTVNHTFYELLKKRNVTLDFDRVTEVIPMYPVDDDEDEQIIADEFLKELLKRRSEREFQNIVFSIQKKQGEIIQTPFHENMIVQGCAGSGKSMIMLHRLPIVLYDNPNSLDRGNLYIITPSLTYIQMANNMMVDLEIEDLRMGTLNQYYDHVLSLYSVPKDVYGKMRINSQLSEDVMKYVYSDTFIYNICMKMEEEIASHHIKYSDWRVVLKLNQAQVAGAGNTSTYYSQIQNEILEGQKIQNEIYSRQRKFHELLRAVVDGFQDLQNTLATHKIAVVNGIRKRITNSQKKLEIRNKEIRFIDRGKNPISYDNRKAAMDLIIDELNDLHEALEVVELDNEYFQKLRSFARNGIETMIRRLRGYSRNFERIGSKDLYQLYELKEYVCDFFDAAKYTLSTYGDAYSDYTDNSEGIIDQLKKMEKSVGVLRNYNQSWLEYEDSMILKTTIEYYTDLLECMPQKIYYQQMSFLNAETDKNGGYYALPCSPYMYLQILFQFKGAHINQKESLITIDEAQNLMPEELLLIRAVNNNKVILNLFGDVKQHIEGSRGIDDWRSFEEVVRFKKYEMRENYRNARQITNYCNKCFKLNMRAINLDGKGVHIIPEQEQFEQRMKRLFLKPQNPGLSCIIVKNIGEAKSILALIPEYRNRIQNLALQPQELHPNRWNLMTVDQVKGLEFETVFAISGRMSKNERYITYTRALDELYVYEEEIQLLSDMQKPAIQVADTRVQPAEKPMSTRKKRQKRTVANTTELQELTESEESDKHYAKAVYQYQPSKKSDSREEEIDIKEYWELSGFEVIDARRKKGKLWVIGERSELEPFVEKVAQKYGVSGKFMKDRDTGFRMAWCVKLF